MELTLEENDEVMDMNKSFYMSDDLDIDLKQIQEPMFEDAQLDFKNMSLDEETMKKKSYMTQGMILPKFGPATKIGDAIDDLFDKNNYKKCKGCRKLKNLLEFRNHEKRCTRKSMDAQQSRQLITTDMFKCLHCMKTFSKKSALVLHVKTTKSCGKGIDGVKMEPKPCKNCSRTFSGRNLSRHIFQGSCKGLSKVIKTLRF